MRIISGLYRGRKLAGGADLSIRPTTDRTKEYIFNVLQDYPVDQRVLDLFSGSGSLGLEALSRAAAKVSFVDNAPASIAVLKDNLAHIKISSHQYEVIRSDALEFCKGSTDGPFGLVLADPPYKYSHIQELIDALIRNHLLQPDGLLVLEHGAKNPIAEKSEIYEIVRQKKISRTLVSFIQHR